MHWESVLFGIGRFSYSFIRAWAFLDIGQHGLRCALGDCFYAVVCLLGEDAMRVGGMRMKIEVKSKHIVHRHDVH
jgi:hypothetical protein